MYVDPSICISVQMNIYIYIYICVWFYRQEQQDLRTHENLFIYVYDCTSHFVFAILAQAHRFSGSPIGGQGVGSRGNLRNIFVFSSSVWRLRDCPECDKLGVMPILGCRFFTADFVAAGSAVLMLCGFCFCSPALDAGVVLHPG